MAYCDGHWDDELDEEVSCDDPDCLMDEEEDDYSDIQWTDMSSDSSPWQFEIPQNVLKTLEKEKVLSKTPGFIESDYNKFYWSQLYPNVRHNEIDVVQAAADFYLLFGLSNHSFVNLNKIQLPTNEVLTSAGRKLKLPENKINKRVKEVENLRKKDPSLKLEGIAEEAREFFYYLVEELDLSFREYTHLACGGELRHHKAFREALDYKYRRGAWVHWHYIYETHGPESLKKMSELFIEFGGGPYGGPAWANASDILYARETGQLGPDEFTNKQLFVDRVFTLEHNGGCFLNKLEWAFKRQNRQEKYKTRFHYMKDSVLQAHCTNPIDIDMLFGHASEGVQKLVQKYLKIAKDNKISIEGIWKNKAPESEESNTPVKKGFKKIHPVPEVEGVEGYIPIDWSAKVEAKKDSSSTPNHAWGHAQDINWKNNPYSPLALEAKVNGVMMQYYTDKIIKQADFYKALGV